MRADAELGGLHQVRSAPSLGYTAPQSCSDSWKLSVCGGMQGGLMEQLVGAVVWGGVSACPPESWHLCEQPITCASQTPIFVCFKPCACTHDGALAWQPHGSQPQAVVTTFLVSACQSPS